MKKQALYSSYTKSPKAPLPPFVLSRLRAFAPFCFRVFVPSFIRVFVHSCFCPFVLSCLRAFVPFCLRVFVPSFTRVFVHSCFCPFVLSCLRAFAPFCFRVFVLSFTRVFVLSFLLSPALTLTLAQTLTKGSGSEFYLTSFAQCPNPEPYGMPDSVIVYIVGTQACTGTAQNLRTGYNLSFTVTPNQVTEIRIPATEAQCSDNEGIQHKAIYLNTTKDVWVYMQTSSRHCEGTFTTQPMPYPDNPAYNYGPSGLIGSTKIPISPVGHFNDEILVYNNIGTNATAYIETIIATEDSTIITIPQVYPVDNDNPNFTERTILLNKGEIYTYSVPWQVFYPENGCVQGISSNCKTIIGFQHWILIDSLQYNNGAYLNLYTEQNNYSQFFSQEFLYFWDSPFAQFFATYPYDLFNPFSLHSIINYTLNVTPFGQQQLDCDWALGVTDAGIRDTTYLNWVSADAPFTLFNITNNIQTEETKGYIVYFFYVNNYLEGFLHYPIPTDKMVSETIFVTQMQQSPRSDSLVSELNIVTTASGRYNMTLNGVTLPPNSFLPIDNCPYYYTRIFYHNDAPDIIHLKNSNGFVASLNQFGYYIAPYGRGDTVCDIRYLTSLGMCHSGGNGDMKASLDALDLSPIRCNNDTLRLHVLNNWFHYPISWIIDSVFYSDREAIAFPLVDSGWLEITLIIGKPDCPDTVTKRVYVVIPPILVNMPTDTMLCPGEYITVYSPNTDQFTWSDGTTSSRLYPKYSGFYTLTASNYCYSVDSTVLIELLDCDNDIYIPNAFTPNGNGLNEIFKPDFTQIERIEEYKFYIYNRWGNLLYFTTDVYDGWTGYGCDAGVYVYIIIYKNRKEKEQKLTGTVALIR